MIRYTIYCPTCEAGRVVYGIKPDQREGFILSISKDLLIINFSGKNSHAFYSGRGISDEFSPADIYTPITWGVIESEERVFFFFFCIVPVLTFVTPCTHHVFWPCMWHGLTDVISAATHLTPVPWSGILQVQVPNHWYST